MPHPVVPIRGTSRLWVARLSLAALLSAVVALPALAEFPYNGDFELGSEAPGWQRGGQWELKAPAARHGRVGLRLPAEVAHVGDYLATAGYLFSRPGEEFHLRLSYVAPLGGLEVALQPCDGLGRTGGDAARERLPATADWVDVDTAITLPAEGLPAEAAAVRLVFTVHREGSGVQLDAVSLSRVAPTRLSPAPKVPKLEVLKVTSLLPIAKGLGSGAGASAAWAAVDLPGFDPRRAQDEPEANPLTGGVILAGGERRAGVISRRVPVDASLPYRVSAVASGAHCQSGQVTLLARLLDPRDPTTVWVQQETRLPASELSHPLTVELPGLSTLPKATALAQVALVLDGGSQGTVSAVTPVLQPVLMSLSVRAAANVKPGPENVSLFVSAANNTTAALKPICWLKTLDPAGNTVHAEKRALIVGSRSAAYFPYKPKLATAGDFTMVARVMAGGRELGAATFAFRVKQTEMLSGMEPVGDRLVSRGYLRVLPTDTVRVSVAYKGNTGGTRAGLVLCDALGQPLGQDLPVDLSPTTQWATFGQRFDLTAVKPAKGVVGAVRLMTSQPDPAAAEDFDAVVVANETTAGRAATSLAYPRVDVKDPRDLLPAAPTEVSGEPWSRWVGFGFADDMARAELDPAFGGLACHLAGSDRPTGLTTQPLALDGSVPYVLRATANVENLKTGQGLLVARLLDPGDTNAVLWQGALPVAAGTPAQRVALSIPRQYADRRAELLQLGIVLEAGADGRLVVVKPELLPEALTVTMRCGVAGAGANDPLRPQVYVSAVNNGQDDLRPNALLTVTNTQGEKVHEEKRAIVIGGRSAAHFPFLLRLPQAGTYQVSVSVMTEGQELGAASMALTASLVAARAD
jgi:hypothetical protein